MAKDVLSTFKISTHKSSKCISTAQSLLTNSYEEFFDVVKYSTNLDKGENGTDDFGSKYVDSLGILNTSGPKYVTNKKFEMVPYCEIAPSYLISEILQNQLIKCPYFEPIVTGKGICYSFNSLDMKQNFANLWDTYFDLKLNTQQGNPTGCGPAHGLNFILNFFQPRDEKRKNRNFIVSITNPSNLFEISRENYTVRPGYHYTFKIMANEIVTTERFNGMDASTRNCFLPHENQNLKFAKIYSKSGCEFECARKYAVTKCNCVPWNIPRLANESTRFCTYNDSSCFEDTVKNFPATNCDCPSDCYGTYLSIFESTRPLEIPTCSEFSTKNYEYPSRVLCEICKNVIKFHRIKLTYDFILDLGLDPTKPDAFCNQFIKENVATVKVEMATRSIVRSVKDKRFNFVGQLSLLGK